MTFYPHIQPILIAWAALGAGLAFGQVAPEDYPRMDWGVVYQHVYDGTLSPDFGAKATFERGENQPPASTRTTADFEIWLNEPVQGLEAGDIEVVGADAPTLTGFEEIPGSNSLGWRFTVENLAPDEAIYPILPSYSVTSGCCGMNNLLQVGQDKAVWVTRSQSYFDWVALATGLSPTAADVLPLADFDHDGMYNLLEYVLDLSVTAPELPGSPSMVGDTFSIEVRNDNPRVSTGFEYSHDLNDWNPVPENDPDFLRTDLGTGRSELSYTWTGPEDIVFFRLIAENDELDGVPTDEPPPVEPPPPPPPPPVNVAQLKPTSQSSTFSDKVSDLAVDGNTDGTNGADSFNHTLSDDEAWWRVDLEAIYDIEDIEIWNRDNQPLRLTNFYVLLSDAPFASTDLDTTLADTSVTAIHVPGTAEYPTTLTAPPAGWTARYIRVQLVGQAFLHMAEVIVNRVTE